MTDADEAYTDSETDAVAVVEAVAEAVAEAEKSGGRRFLIGDSSGAGDRRETCDRNGEYSWQ